MLTDKQKKEYMAIMHDYSQIRSRIEKFLHPDDSSDANSNKSSKSVVPDTAQDNPPMTEQVGDEDEALAQLRAKLNI